MIYLSLFVGKIELLITFIVKVNNNTKVQYVSLHAGYFCYGIPL